MASIGQARRMQRRLAAPRPSPLPGHAVKGGFQQRPSGSRVLPGLSAAGSPLPGHAKMVRPAGPSGPMATMGKVATPGHKIDLKHKLARKMVGRKAASPKPGMVYRGGR